MLRMMLTLVAGILASCAHVAPHRADCGEPIAGAAAVLERGATVIIGEVHGTRELPYQFGDLVCLAAHQGPVLVGLEQPGADDSPPDLRDAFWSSPYQDGRGSVAMFELRVRLQAMKAAGLPVSWVLFDATPADARERDREMAANVERARSKHPGATVLLLAGNLHARKVPGNPFTRQSDYRWMGGLLGKVTTLDGSGPPGTAWVCYGDTPESCGPDLWQTPQFGSGIAAVSLRPSGDRAYDGEFEVPTLTASPPAVQRDDQRSFDEKLQVLQRSPQAFESIALWRYEKGDFTGCARAIASIAAPNANQWFRRARCAARAGLLDEAFSALTAATAAGFNEDATLAAVEDLAPLRADERWKSFLLRK